MDEAGMTGQAIIAVSAAVVALTQLIKWAGVPDRFGPLSVLVLAALGVAVWGFTQGTVVQQQAFDYFAGWIAVATSAAGVYGFTRAAPEAVSSFRSPPAPPRTGAGMSATEKEN